jgi:Rrf2 family protein
VIFSAKAEYGVRLMVELGRHEGAQPLSLRAIAQSEGLPLDYMEHVVARLKKAGLVTSSRGVHGGYQLARPSDQIPMDQVVLALEGSIAPMECFVQLPTERVTCSHQVDGGRACATRLLWTRVQGGVIKALQATSLSELVEFSDRQPGAPPLASALETATIT